MSVFDLPMPWRDVRADGLVLEEWLGKETLQPWFWDERRGDSWERQRQDESGQWVTVFKYRDGALVKS